MCIRFSRNIEREGKSAGKAKERLKEVLMLDRTNLSQKELDGLKDDLIKTISRYVDIEVNSFRIDLKHEGQIHRLTTDVPVRPSHQRRAG